MDRLRRALVFAPVCLLLFAASASADTRYAAPGGTGADPCTDPGDPCSIYTAADRDAPSTTIEAGDVVELAPGTYSEAAGDLGPDDNVTPPSGVVVRGEPGEVRPLIVLQTNQGFWGAFFVGSAVEVMDVEILNLASSGSAISVQGGMVERVVARSTFSTAFTCTFFEGTMLSSACINEAGGTAIGVSSSTAAGTYASTLRNSTFIATGPGSVGMDFAYFASSPGVIGAINAIGVISKGEAKDVIARGLELSGGHGATTSIELQASDYATTDVKTAGTGSASVTAPGTNGNITATPLLDTDNVHQLPGSPTIDKGAVDGASATVDIDEQARTIGLTADIGADELGNPTKTTVVCAPSTVAPGGESACTVTVEDLGTVLTQPSGDVLFSTGGSCTLVGVTEASSQCSIAPLSGLTATQTITAVYEGGPEHEGSEGSAQITVTAPSGGGAGGDDGVTGGQGGSNQGKANPAPVTKLGKHPPKRTTKRKAKFTFTSNEAGSRFECKLDNKPFRDCASPFRKKVGLGGHKFQVRAIDAQGKADPTPAVFRWKVLPPS